MKHGFDEISDDEREKHSFKPSRVLETAQNQKCKRKPPAPLPLIESFAFKKSEDTSDSYSSSDDCVEITRPVHINLEKEKAEEENLEDDDVEEDGFQEVMRPPKRNRGRRFIVDDDEEEEEEEGAEEEEEERKEMRIEAGFTEVYDLDSSDKEEEEELEFEEDDVVVKALQKCAKISAELKKELYGSGVTSCERYAEGEASSVRIVTQSDIDAACAVADSDFQPVLKPYQLVGVNFLLLLYRKGIAGAILADEMGLGKAIQAVTYLMLLKHLNNDPGPHLIVCPASVLENWERELKKWCPSFSVLRYDGATRAAYSKKLSSLAKAGLPPPFNVLLVCYSLFERHSAQQKNDRKILKRWQWSCVLMD